MCDAVGQAIGAGGARREGAASGLGLALDARGDTLVLLDEMEGAAGAAAETVGAWLAAAPSAGFLITSREPLHLAGEALFELGPLDGGRLVRGKGRHANPDCRGARGSAWL